MPKYIRIESTGAAYRLPADTDLDQLRDDIRSAHRDNRSVEVVVEVQDDPRRMGFLVLNPSLPAFLLAELPEDGLGAFLEGVPDG